VQFKDFGTNVFATSNHKSVQINLTRYCIVGFLSNPLEKIEPESDCNKFRNQD